MRTRLNNHGHRWRCEVAVENWEILVGKVAKKQVAQRLQSSLSSAMGWMTSVSGLRQICR